MRSIVRGILIGLCAPMMALAMDQAPPLSDVDGQYESWYAHVNASAREQLARYDAALANKPGDPDLTVARCELIGSFADNTSDLLSDWVLEELDTCTESLASLPANVPSVALHRADAGDLDAKAIEALLDGQARQWTQAQRARLHAALYRRDAKAPKAGFHAARAWELDPDQQSAVHALAYYAQHDRARFLELAARLPRPERGYELSEQLNSVLDADEPKLAHDLLDKARAAKFSVDNEVAARVALANQDWAAARAVLDDYPHWKIKQPDYLESRARLARGSGAIEDARAALPRINDPRFQFGRDFGLFVSLVLKHPGLLADPAAVPYVLMAIFVLLALVFVPLLLLAPAHYAGLLLQRRGARYVPTFEQFGIRHAWYALAVAMIVPMLVGAVLEPAALSRMLGGDAAEVGADGALWRLQLFGTLAALIALAPLWLRLPRAAWGLGRLSIGGAALRIFLCWMLVLGVAIALGALIANNGGDQADTEQLKIVRALSRQLDSRFGFIAAWCVIALLAPVFEELVFRAIALAALSRYLPFVIANVLQAFVFALIHGDTPRFAFYFTLGLACGWLTRRSGSLLPGIGLHMLQNTFALVLMKYSGMLG